MGALAPELSVLALATPLDRVAMRKHHAHLSDEALVALVARGDEDALAELYDRVSRIAYGLALRVLRDEREAPRWPDAAALCDELGGRLAAVLGGDAGMRASLGRMGVDVVLRVCDPDATLTLALRDGDAAVVWPLAARAQQGEGVRRIGVLMSAAAADMEGHARIAAFRRAGSDSIL